MIRDATPEDVEFLSSRLREADINEVRASGGEDPLTALRRGLAHSQVCKVGLSPSSGNPGFIWGVVPMSLMTGGVWAVGTDDLDKHKMTFLRRCSEPLQELQSLYPVLYNFVDARNSLHITWLKWMGFRIIKEHPRWGYEQRPFYEFVRIDPNV